MCNLQGGPSRRSSSMPSDKSVTTARFLAHDVLRDGQISMINDGLEVMSNEGFLLANAPTGIGKTAAALASALTVARTGDGKHVIFMTGRQSQHRIVVDTVHNINNRLDENQSKVALVDMIGRESMCEYVDRGTGKCSCEQGTPESERENRRAGLRNLILSEPRHVDFTIKEATNRRVCAWATARSAAADADILVCDYNHVFIESVRKASLPSMGIELENCIIVVDEAHNLPDRIRRSLSRNLNDKILRDAIFNLEEHCETLEKKATQSTIDAANATRARACEKALRRFKKRLATWIRDQRDKHRNPGDVGAEIEVRVEGDYILSMLRQELSGDISGEKIDLDGLIAQLFLIQVEMDEDEDELPSERLAIVLSILNQYAQSPAMCVVLTSRGDENRITTHLLDPAIMSEEVFRTVRGGVLMSGTLTPPQMYADSLGISSERPMITQSYPSPFLADRRPVLVASDVTSKYTARGPENTRKIRRHIHALLQSTPGHVAVFCQSYRMLEEIIEEADWPGRMLLIESRTWSKKRVDNAIQQLRDARQRGTKVLIAGVFGGRLSEGVDYSGNILDAVVCVGIPIAPKSVPQDALREYIDGKHQGMGWMYGALQPAVNSVLQGMGRAIRKSEDRAFILLLDNRLLTGQYRMCLPSTLHTFTANDSKRTGRMVKRFFEHLPEPAKGD